MSISPTVDSLVVVHGERFIAPGAPVFRSRARRAFDIAGDIGLAVLLVWSVPLAWGIAVALGRGVIWLTR